MGIPAPEAESTQQVERSVQLPSQPHFQPQPLLMCVPVGSSLRPWAPGRVAPGLGVIQPWMLPVLGDLCSSLLLIQEQTRGQPGSPGGEKTATAEPARPLARWGAA